MPTNTTVTLDKTRDKKNVEGSKKKYWGVGWGPIQMPANFS